MDAKNNYKRSDQVYAYPRGAKTDDQAFDGWQFLAMACSLNAVFFKYFFQKFQPKDQMVSMAQLFYGISEFDQ